MLIKHTNEVILGHDVLLCMKVPTDGRKTTNVKWNNTEAIAEVLHLPRIKVYTLMWTRV